MPLPRWLHRRPRTRRGWLLTAGATSVAALAGAFAFLYFVVLGTSSPPPLSLSRSTASGTPVPAPALAGSQLAGTWTVASGSAAGYRVREQLADLPAQTDAVGRTSSITGSATLSGSSSVTVTAASFSVDVSTLASDRSMRDNRIHSIGLESDRFPTATFTLSSPAAIPATAPNGQIFHVSITGKLTIHGTRRTEAIPVDARLSGTQIEVVGSITFPWSDFGMSAPSIGGFVSVTDSATMEFDIKLQHG